MGDNYSVTLFDDQPYDMSTDTAGKSHDVPTHEPEREGGEKPPEKPPEDFAPPPERPAEQQPQADQQQPAGQNPNAAMIAMMAQMQANFRQELQNYNNQMAERIDSVRRETKGPELEQWDDTPDGWGQKPSENVSTIARNEINRLIHEGKLITPEQIQGKRQNQPGNDQQGPPRLPVQEQARIQAEGIQVESENPDLKNPGSPLYQKCKELLSTNMAYRMSPALTVQEAKRQIGNKAPQQPAAQQPSQSYEQPAQRQPQTQQYGNPAAMVPPRGAPPPGAQPEVKLDQSDLKEIMALTGQNRGPEFDAVAKNYLAIKKASLGGK